MEHCSGHSHELGCGLCVPVYSEEFPVQDRLDGTSLWLRHKMSEREILQPEFRVAERELAKSVPDSAFGQRVPFQAVF